MKNILLVDDHLFLLDLLETTLAKLGDANIIKASSLENLSFYVGAAPDLIVLDWMLPGISGIEAIQRLRSKFPASPIAILSGQDLSLNIVERAMSAGAKGYIPKTSSSEDLLRELRKVLAGGESFPIQILRAIEASSKNSSIHYATLTPRQLSVLQMLIKGEPNKTIARVLNIGEATVKTHIGAAMRILGARNRTEVAHRARELRII